MATDRTITSLGGCCVGYRYRFLAVSPFRPYQVELVTGVYIMAGKAGNPVFHSGMQVVQIADTIPEAVFLCFLLCYQ